MIITETIESAKASKKNVDQVGSRFLKFCGKYDLVKIAEQVDSYVKPLNARYINECYS